MTNKNIPPWNDQASKVQQKVFTILHTIINHVNHFQDAGTFGQLRNSILRQNAGVIQTIPRYASYFILDRIKEG